ncbi:MAG: D-alanine--D-alanine ligase [Oscillospiraceae bacterium]|nr:D-alanine--D-alanine ligase [Oscillospiraceae bacterium]
MKIVVLCGGLSPERNVSLSSGKKIAAALSARGHQVVPVDMYLGLEDYAGDIRGIFDAPPALDFDAISEVAPDLEAVRASRRWQSPSQFGLHVLEVCQMADVVFMALHGRIGEDGRVQATFDMLGIPYTGSGFLGSAIAMDKDLTKRLVAPEGVRTPKWQLVESASLDVDAVCAVATYPCVVKPDDSGSSIGVAIAQNEAELRAALAEAAREGSRILVEQYVSGREVQIGILGDKCLPSIEIIPAEGFYDYKNKYQPGAAKEITPAPVPPEVEQELARQAMIVFKTLGLRAYSRADFILDAEGKLWFLEINTLPGMTPTSLVPQEAAVVGIEYGALCEKIIALSLEA